MRRFIGAAAVMLVLSGFVLAETVRGLITSADDKEIKVTVRKKGEKKGEERTIKVTKDTKYAKRKGKDESEDSTLDALKEAISNAKGKVKGVFAAIEVDGEGDSAKVTKITYGGGRRKKKNDTN